MSDHNYREEELRQQDEERNFKHMAALIERHHGRGELYAKYIMDNIDYLGMTFSDILVLCDDLEVCEQCGEVTEQEYMHDGEWDDDICEWCWGNGQ